MLPDGIAGEEIQRERRRCILFHGCLCPLFQVNLARSKYEITRINLNMNELGQKLRKYLWIYLQKGNNMFADIITK